MAGKDEICKKCGARGELVAGYPRGSKLQPGIVKWKYRCPNPKCGNVWAVYGRT